MIKKSDYFILLAISISFITSAYFWFMDEQSIAIFTALWVPSILCFAIYFKVLGLIEFIKSNRSLIKKNQSLLKERKG